MRDKIKTERVFLNPKIHYNGVSSARIAGHEGLNSPTAKKRAGFSVTGVLDSAERDCFARRMPVNPRVRPPSPLYAALPRESIWVFLLGVALLAASVFGTYHRALDVPFLLDDRDSIEANPTLKQFSTALFPPGNSGITVSGRPLLNFSLAVNHHLGGNEVAGYHLGNCLIHFLASLCLWGVVRRTLLLPTLAPRFGGRATVLAWFVALLWALHPLQTESVTYIIQRAESLVGLFYLLTFYAFIRSVSGAGRGWTVATCVFCFLGMACKEVMASAPLVLLLYDRAFVSGSFAESLRTRKKLYAGLAASWLFLLLLILSTGGRGGSVGFATVTWWEYALTQTTAVVRYLGLALWPARLVFDYGAIVEKDLRVIVPCVVVVVALLGATLFACKRFPRAGFLGAAAVLILAPSSSVVPIATQTIAEHRFYLPLAALVVGVVLGLDRLSSRFAPVILSLLAVALAVATHARNEVYRSKLRLWEDTARKVPDNVRALDNLGAVYFDLGRTEESIPCFRRAIELMPNYASAYNNLGQSLIREGKPKEGLEAIETALRFSPERAAYHVAYGNALLELNQPERAIASLEHGSAMEPDNGGYHYDLANALAALDRNEEAERHFLAALEANPKDIEVLNNYSTLLRRMGRADQAIAYLEVALQLAPQSARVHSNLGVSFLMSKRVDEAIRELQEAVRVDPKLPQARYNLANAFAQTGRANEAIEQFEALLSVTPPTAELLSNLAVLYAQTNRLEDAAASLRRALEINPHHEAARENLEKINAFLARRKR